MLRPAFASTPLPRPSHRRRWHGSVAAWRWSICGLAALGFIPRGGASPAASEYALKAALLFHFTQFVEWPATAFASPQAPFVIGVFGRDPFGSTLDGIAASEHVGSHPIVVTRCRTLADARACQLLFIGPDQEPDLRAVLAAVQDQPVLTVADFPGFVGRGGMISLERRADGHLRLRIDAPATRAAGLRVSAKLLRVAEPAAAP